MRLMNSAMEENCGKEGKNMILVKDGMIALEGNVIEELYPEMTGIVAALYQAGLGTVKKKPEDASIEVTVTKLIYECVKFGIDNVNDLHDIPDDEQELCS